MDKTIWILIALIAFVALYFMLRKKHVQSVTTQKGVSLTELIAGISTLAALL